MKRLNIKSETRYGKLVIISEVSPIKDRNGSKRRRFSCKCDCGKIKIIRLLSLTSGNSKSCGCDRIKSITNHGRSNTSEHRAWIDMRQRCLNKNHDRYNDWGGRGIEICERWDSFEKFIEDMGSRPTKKHSLDRINNDGDYELSNCRWATIKQQQNNRRKYKKRKSSC
ncbi:MAG: hypothetical protein JRJ27_17250 [Deltaproteobacteria bacterium]|nr:hypothetical protein [Deltaproteobacteria bacterium]